MIPTYNCATFLSETLRSVLEQDPGREQMQIEVVDDASMDRPEDVVTSVGSGRASFFRQPANHGAIANFNTCIERSRGHLIHILHGDDLVRPGFYRRMTQLSQQWPTAALLATRAFHIDEPGTLLGISSRLPQLEQEGRDPGRLLYVNHLVFAAVVIRRSFYEASGGFITSLVHTADWEMWIRAISMGGGVVSSDVLASYRIFEGNDTSRLRRSAENLRDYIRFSEIIAARVPEFDGRRFRAGVAGQALAQAQFFLKLGDQQAARANENVWQELTSFMKIFRRAARGTFDALHELLRDLRRKLPL